MSISLIIGIVILVLLAWMAFKAISLVVRLALYAAMALLAYWLFAQAFGFPLPTLLGG